MNEDYSDREKWPDAFLLACYCDEDEAYRWGKRNELIRQAMQDEILRRTQPPGEEFNRGYLEGTRHEKAAYNEGFKAGYEQAQMDLG